MSEYTDFLVDTANPAALDETLRELPGGAALVGGPKDFVREDGHYVMRVFGDPGFVKFACENQGYCRIVGEAAR